MDLNIRVDVKIARVDVNYQTVTVTKFYDIFFFVLISFNTKVPLILQTRYQLNIPSHFLRNRLKCQGRRNFLGGRRKFSNGLVT